MSLSCRMCQKQFSHFSLTNSSLCGIDPLIGKKSIISSCHLIFILKMSSLLNPYQQVLYDHTNNMSCHLYWFHTSKGRPEKSRKPEIFVLQKVSFFPLLLISIDSFNSSIASCCSAGRLIQISQKWHFSASLKPRGQACSSLKPTSALSLSLACIDIPWDTSRLILIVYL